jgi:hypothetical protein
MLLHVRDRTVQAEPHCDSRVSGPIVIIRLNRHERYLPVGQRNVGTRVRGRDAGDGTAVYRKQIDEDRGGSNCPNSTLVDQI